MALENSKQNIVLDLTYPVLQNIRCVQYDTESRIIGITITDNSKLYKILDTYGIIFKQSKPDCTFVERRDACTILSDGTIELLLPEQSTTCPGLSKCQLEIVDNSVIHTLHFNLVVEKSVIGNQDIESQVDFDILTDMYKHLTDYDNPHKMPIASDKEPGIIKSGTDITVDDSGNVSVNDNSHKHTVSNISDLTATANELNVLDGITATTTELNYTDGVTSNIQTQLNSKASLESPALTGAPTSPTASAGTNTTQIATTAFVQTAVKNAIAVNVVGSSTATSNTTTALTNGNVYLNSVENGAVTSSHKISGSGGTTVTTDTSGNIIINSSNTGRDTYALKSKYGDTTINVGRVSSSVVGNYSSAIGYATIASGDYSSAEGYDTEATGECSHAEGYNTGATGNFGSHAEGSVTTASGSCSHAEGQHTIASATMAHAEGNSTTASGDYSHSEGYSTNATGKTSHAEGWCTTASGDYQHVQGKYNLEDRTKAFIIGNGTSNDARSNALSVDWDGNVAATGYDFGDNGISPTRIIAYEKEVEVSDKGTVQKTTTVGINAGLHLDGEIYASNFKGLAANLTTTTTGLALDATMGKTLQDKITANANAISTLNSNMSNVIDYTNQLTKNTDVIAGMFTTNIRKIGQVVSFGINITVKSVSSSEVLLGTLPEGVRPTIDICWNTLTNNGDDCYIYINRDGEFGIRKMAHATTGFTANDGVRSCVSYITEE